MTDWSALLLALWADHTPWLMLATTILLLLTGYPVAFILGAVALFFGWTAYQSGLVGTTGMFERLPELLFNQILLDPALLSLPLLFLFTELLVETGQMQRASLAIKTAFNPDHPRQERSRDRGATTREAKDKSNGDMDRARSQTVMIFLPAAMLAILVARDFELPPEYLTFALLLPVVCLFALYTINWLLDLWVKSDHRKMGAVAATTDGEQIRPDAKEELSHRLWDLLPPLALALFGLGLLVYCGVSLFVTLAALSLVVCLLALLQGRLQFKTLVSVSNRAVLASGSLAAMLLGAFCFHAVFIEIGGRDILHAFSVWAFSPETASEPWVLLFGLILCLVLVGLLVDWVILVFVVIPILLPLFSDLDFNSLLTPIWAGASTQMASINPANILTANGLILQERLWLAALVWFALLTSLATYIRQNGEFGTKRLAPDSRKTQDRPTSMILFLLLQIVGLTAILIAPQSVLWLPSLLIG